ncbi:MAG: ATP-dependent DNA helicase [Micavibrio sp.]|nr:MAG: ATP-dependent DNA helicase [Micavibrio sp.]
MPPTRPAAKTAAGGAAADTALQAAAPRADIALSVPVLIADRRKAVILTAGGEILMPKPSELGRFLAQHMPLVCHAPATAAQLGISPFAAYDILEIFAFVHPARFCLPSVAGVAAALDLPVSVTTTEDQCIALLESAQHLLAALTAESPTEHSDPVAIAAMMGLATAADVSGEDNGGQSNAPSGWPWAPLILQALDKPHGHHDRQTARAGTKIWNRLQEWAEEAPPPPPGHESISAPESAAALQELLAARGGNTQPRAAQLSYAEGIVPAFHPRNRENLPNTVIAEAGTGTGKTLGYIAPAGAWAEKNQGCVWISTYTKNLQKQVDEELAALYPDAEEKKRKVVIRKGRENYLCLLNLEEAMNNPAAQNNPRYATGLGLVARWTAATRDGDLYGGDMPGWLPSLIGWRTSLGLSDRRGECIFSACQHYHRCFVEKSQRLSQRARIVVANHALVMHRTALSHPHDVLPSRYVFDEGHHLFDAADSAFALHLSGREAADLRRWLLGLESETGTQMPGRSRNRGLKRRLEELIADDEKAQHALDDALDAARTLPGYGWQKRVQSGQPKGLTEGFLQLVREQVYARNTNGRDVFYSLETQVLPPIEGLYESAYALSCRLRDLSRPLQILINLLQDRLETQADTLASDTKKRIESVCHSLHFRANLVIAGWVDMLGCLQSQTGHEAFVDWFQVERIEGREYDIGMYRHWVDPTVPFAANLKPHAHGVLVTSASLTDDHGAEGGEQNWNYVARQTGAAHLTEDGGTSAHRLQLPSPFDYAAQSRILVVTDIPRDKTGQIAKAYAALFKAAGGGALGLFTAIQRLKAVHARLLPELEESDMKLYAQHLDGLDPSTLTAMFRMEENACMLGTDATRDGMDVPGRALRLIVFDRVPWPRPTILHKARRDYFGRGYDDRVTRFRLKQAYGRLIRHETDKGVFVMLDSRLPTRLTSAFPKDVLIERVGLADAVNIIKSFLQQNNEF